MQSPTVLKAIYSLEHGQSTERLAQTLLRLGVPPSQVAELTQNTPGGVGANWMTMAERIASERAARGQTVVPPELLRAANAMVAQRDTVRIHIQKRVSISPPPQQHPPVSGPGLAPISSVQIPPRSDSTAVFSSIPGQGAPHILASNLAGNPATPARRVTAVVPVAPGPRAGNAAPWASSSAAALGLKSTLRMELEDAVRLLAANPGLETGTLSSAQSQALREALRPVLMAGAQSTANNGNSSTESVPMGASTSEQKPISLRGPVKL